MYIIKYTSGSYDSFHIGVLFVTENEELAKLYCEKANRILKSVKEFMVLIDEKLDQDIERDKYIKLWSKYYNFEEVNSITYESIEVR